MFSRSTRYLHVRDRQRDTQTDRQTDIIMPQCSLRYTQASRSKTEVVIIRKYEHQISIKFADDKSKKTEICIVCG